MSLDNPKSGIGYAAEFQSSGLPWVTSSQAPVTPGFTRIDFPKVTRFLTFANHDAAAKELRIGFTQNGMANGKYFMLDGGQVVTLEVRVKTVYVAGDTSNVPYALCAGLTNVDSSAMPVLTGTYSDGSAGWQGVG